MKIIQLLTVLTLGLSAMAQAETRVAHLRCESIVNPHGIDQAQPRLSWKMESARPGAAQTAYHIDIPGVWDSGKVDSDKSVAIPYAGKPLESGKIYNWRVRVWDEKGAVSDWIESARWSMGKLKPEDWSARWIAAPLARRGDRPVVAVTKATYSTLDGSAKVDVTPVLQKAVKENGLPFLVGPGRLGAKAALNVVSELVVEYTYDGKPGLARARDREQLDIPKPSVSVPAPWFRGEFDLPAPAESALLTILTAAYFELYVNGDKVSEDVLMPAVSETTARTFSVTYDVKALLKPGRNCIGIWAAMGRMKNVALRAQLDVVAGGKSITFGTGPDWKTRPSGVSHIGGWKGGEYVNVSHHIPDWAKPGLDTNGWTAVVGAEREAPAGPPVNQLCPPNRIRETITPASITPLADGRYEIDFGTNLTGWLRMKLPGLKAGQTVRMHFADRLFPDGVQATPIGNIKVKNKSARALYRADGGFNLYQNYGQKVEFVSAGQPDEEFQHRFNYAAFRYVIVEGLTRAPKIDEVKAMLVESALPIVGTFDCSDPLLNRIHKVNQWTMRSLNLGGYYVDCPHRERLGYGDGQVALQGMMMNFDSANYYSKWAKDWNLALEKKNEHLNYVAPPHGSPGGGPPWPGAIALIPWQHFLHYGNTKVLEENIEAARSYSEYLDGRSTDDILRAWTGGIKFLGDWVPPGRGMDDSKNWPSKEMAELFCNCYRVHMWQLLGNMAAALGRTEEARHARERATAIAAATHAAFYDAANKRYVIDEQIYYAFPLLVGVTPESERPAVLENLVRCITEKNKGHLDTGMLGTLFLINYLQEIDRDDLILGIYQKKDYPGWGYMVEQGATTLWEQWNGHYSQIHSCFTSADNWLYHGLAGIRPDPAKPGFKNVIIEPAVTGNLTWAKATHDGPYGPISSHWQRDGDKLVLDVVIPPNSTATVRLPGQKPEQVPAGKHHFETRIL